jgi:CBS domain containing-hemolysin-like protein
MLGHIPTVSENAVLGEHEVTVLEADPTRVRRVRIRRLKPDEIAEISDQ